MARAAGAFVVEINPEPTPLTPLADVSLRGTAAALVPAIVEARMSTPTGTREADAAWGRRRLLDLPAEDRPRERLVRHGAGALSNRELLAVVLGTGTSKASALDVAETLLALGIARAGREVGGRAGDGARARAGQGGTRGGDAGAGGAAGLGGPRRRCPRCARRPTPRATSCRATARGRSRPSGSWPSTCVTASSARP